LIGPLEHIPEKIDKFSLDSFKVLLKLIPEEDPKSTLITQNRKTREEIYQEFVNEKVRRNLSARVKSNNIWERFAEWCIARNYETGSSNSFYKWFAGKDFEFKTTHHVRYYCIEIRE
jgi:hypothetical protein